MNEILPCVRQPATLKAFTGTEFCARDIPKGKFILDALIQEASLNMIHAPRGLGKTHLALAICGSIAGGTSFLKYTAPSPKKVLYLDGEMQAYAMQQRLSNFSETALENFTLINADDQEYGMPDLASEKGQRVYEQHTAQADFIVVDNISCLCRSGAENKADDWNPVATWLLRMRSQGRTVLLVHHAGKNGTQRGTSKREDLLDVVISLRKTAYESIIGAAFEIHIEKDRPLGIDTRPYTAKLSPEGVWTQEKIEQSTKSEVLKLYAKGELSQADIAKKLDKSRSTISRHIKKAQETGELSKQVGDQSVD